MKTVLSLDKAISLRERWRSEGQSVVFTNGCFDILHVGHIRYLQAARAQGDLLLVGLNGDASMRRLKGPRRPILPQDERAEILSALACVDYVVIFDDDTAEPLVTLLRPDIYVKGGDYSASSGEKGKKDLPEARIVASYGGRTAIIPLVAGHSTTDIMTTILERYCTSPEPH